MRTISASILLDNIDSIIHHITDIINQSLLEGYVPTVFKLAIIKPLLKKLSLDATLVLNFRPISLLPFISKLLETVACNQISSQAFVVRMCFQRVEEGDSCEGIRIYIPICPNLYLGKPQRLYRGLTHLVNILV